MFGFTSKGTVALDHIGGEIDSCDGSGGGAEGAGDETCAGGVVEEGDGGVRGDVDEREVLLDEGGYLEG